MAEFEDHLKAAQVAAVAETLGDNPNRNRLADIGIDALNAAEVFLRRFYDTRPADGPPACAAGCTYCCHQYVGVSVPELAALTKFIRARMSDAEIDGLSARLTEVGERTEGMKRFERAVAGLDCPLLNAETRQCTVYEARPLTCRGMHSLSVAACEANDAAPDREVAIPQYESHKGVTRSIAIGVQLGLKEAGHEVEELELTAALRIALTVPDAFERWLAGDNVFADCTVPPA